MPDHDATFGRAPATSRRRSWLQRAAVALGAAAVGPALSQAGRPDRAMTLYTFGDSILDCGRYNPHGITPGQLLVRNDDALFPEFAGRDLTARGLAPRLVHRAVDGATSDDLQRQLPASFDPPGSAAVALVTIGGNDLLRGLAGERAGHGLQRFERTVRRFAAALPVPTVVFANVYDPTFGDDQRNFLGIEPVVARANLRRVNDVLAAIAARHGRLVDLHAHFLRGDPSWFTNTIEPSLVGASEVRRVFLDAL
jgi:acyl-CoA thioesterase-1